MSYRLQRLCVIAFACCGAGVGILSVSDQGAGLAVLFGAIGGVAGTAIGSAIFGFGGTRPVEFRPPIPTWNWTDGQLNNFWRERVDSPVPNPPDLLSDKHMMESDRRD